MRLVAVSRVSAELQLAQRLIGWLRGQWNEPAVSLPDIYQRGPNAIRDKARAARIVSILEDHGFLVRIEGGADIEGNWRRDAWRLTTEG